ncbi:MAG: DUF2092 domain-containing protein [Gammaproteobacteria bacterium]|nr:DUF2092 domain-containing protein [Gammaproteobacteria bacterium]
MKQLILLLLVSFVLNPISVCAHETNGHDEVDSSAIAHLPMAANKPGVSKEAWGILTHMTEFISGAQAYTIVVTLGHEVVQKNGQRLELGSYVTATMRRPSQANVLFETRDGDNATVILDGETISVFSTKEKMFVYDTARQPGDIDASFDYLTQVLGTNDQLRDFFAINLTETLAGLVKSGFYLGESNIEGVLCDNLVLRSEDQDVQLWIAKGSHPAPRRIVVTYKKIEGQPQFWAQFVEWDFSPEISDSMFKFSLPEDAEHVDFFSQ